MSIKGAISAIHSALADVQVAGYIFTPKACSPSNLGFGLRSKIFEIYGLRLINLKFMSNAFEYRKCLLGQVGIGPPSDSSLSRHSESVYCKGTLKKKGFKGPTLSQNMHVYKIFLRGWNIPQKIECAYCLTVSDDPFPWNQFISWVNNIWLNAFLLKTDKSFFWKPFTSALRA